MRHITLIIAVVMLAVAAPAIAGKGGNPNGGNGNGNASGNTNGNGNGNRDQGPSPTLTATPDVLHAGDYFDVSGCGFDTSQGNVVVGFTGGGWGSPLDSEGCFTIAGIPALSGDTLPPGTYAVTAYQYVNGKLTEVAETTVTVVL